MIVADRDGVGLDARSHVEIGVGDDFSFAPGVNQKARMAIPLYEVVAQRQSSARSSLNHLSPAVEEPDQRRITHCLGDLP
jgi:hypothetical protein